MATGRTTPLAPAIRLLLVALPLAACEAGEIRLVGPDDATGSENTVELHVTVEDAALAGALGWEVGVPGATAEWAFVHQARYVFHEAVSDSAGVIRFERDGRGWHWVAAEKDVEIDGERRVLGGAAKTTGSTAAELSLRLDDPGTLVISEIYMDEPPPWEADYDGSKYIELYNNSPQVVYLDGMLLGKAYDIWRDYTQSGHHPCDFTKPFRDDPDAIWSSTHWRFPGSGTDHPVAPGEAVVIAMNAADHTAVHPSMLDLSHAELEFGSAGAADNPSAANMENVSSNHGGSTEFLISSAFWFLSHPVELSTLPILTDEWRGPTYVDYRGIPAGAIIDVSVQWWDTTNAEPLTRSPPCEHPIHPSFDALPGGYLYGSARPEDLLLSPQRKVVRTEAGRAILQDTNTSATGNADVAPEASLGRFNHAFGRTVTTKVPQFPILTR